MVVSHKIFLLLFISTLNIVKSVTIDDFITCNSQQKLERGRTYYIKYPESNLRTPKCTYLVKSPPGSFILAVIYHNISGTEPLCRVQRIRVSRSGDNLMRDVLNFCGLRIKNPLQVNSIGNEMAFEMVSETISGYFQIALNYARMTQNNCDCSWSLNTKIIAGTRTKPNEFVFHVAFVTSTAGAFREAFCGGTIISQNYIVSAGHCIFAIKNEYNWKVTVEVGRHNITELCTHDTIYAASYGIKYAIVHSSYNSASNSHDIGLVRTSSYIKFSQGVGPACLPFSYKNYAVPSRTIMTAIGFGSTEFAYAANIDQKSWTLRKVQLIVNSTLSLCKGNVYKMCARGGYNIVSRQHGDTCQRDSGGGVYGYMDNRYFVFGIVSEGMACGATNSYSVNTYVPKYLDWIQKNIGNELLCRK